MAHQAQQPCRPTTRAHLIAWTIGVASMVFVLDCGDASTLGTQRQVVLGPAVGLTPDTTFYGVRDVSVSPHLGIWVLSRDEPFVAFVSNAGKEIRRFGRRGRGPGELANPYALVKGGRADEVTVWDLGNQKLVTFDSTGSVVGELPWGSTSGGFIREDIENISYGDPFEIAYTEGNYVVARYDGLSGTSDFLHGRIVTADNRGSTSDTIVDFWRDIWSRHDRSEARELVDIPLWAPCGRGEIVLFEPFGPSVRWMTADGELSHVERLNLTPHRLTHESMATHMWYVAENELAGKRYDSADVAKRLADVLDAHPDMFPSHEPLAVRLLCGRDGRAWLDSFSPTAGLRGWSRNWIEVGRDGTQRDFRMPPRFTPWVVDSDEVVGVVTDSLNLQGLARIELPPTTR